MLEILNNLLVLWLVSIIISVMLIISSILVYVLNKKRRRYMNEHFGLKEFFIGSKSSGRYSMLVFVILLIPILNTLLGIACLTAFCTDVGDKL